MTDAFRRIDAHVHLWKPDEGQDILIVQQKPELARAANVTDLKRTASDLSCSASIVVQS